mmetsp:Transcript_674/g.1260  ORF Transcript_674/g.1260 Transcript_674/m.1260 type:complete len:173 (+) Transcript_674:138-656(+)
MDLRDWRAYNNSSSMSNFIFPQTTNRTNRSYRSGNGRNFALNGLAGLNIGNGSTNANNQTMSNLQRYGNALVERAAERPGGETDRNLISALSQHHMIQRQQHNHSQQNMALEVMRIENSGNNGVSPIDIYNQRDAPEAEERKSEQQANGGLGRRLSSQRKVSEENQAISIVL